MKYRSKLYLALAGIALISSLLGFTLLFYEFRHHAFTDMQTKVLTVAATTAALIDPEPLKQINKRSDEESTGYSAVKQELIKARDANRREDILLKFLYILKPDPADPNQLIYVVDAEENPPQISHAGQIDQNAYVSGVILHLEDYYSPGKFTADPWGLWLSGFAPVYDTEGKYVATVGADISVERYRGMVHTLIQFFSLAFLVSLLFAFIGGYFLARRVTLSLRTLLSCVREIGQGNFSARSSLQTRDEFEELGKEVNRMAQGLKERERLKENFARYVSHHVMEKILDAEHVVNLEGERRKITVLFSDIRQFTQLSEELPPEQVVSLLNTYFKSMLDIIFHYQGTLDKFLGDGIMVEFGAPLDDSLQEKHAVQAAIAMHKELGRLNAKWKSENHPIIDMGIGIHTGLAVVGNIGSEKRIDYTAIGDTVNVASRLEQATKQLKTPILISETTYLAVKEEIQAIHLGLMTLPGRKEAITVYSIPIEDLHP
jgi:adenylate cyclase